VTRKKRKTNKKWVNVSFRNWHIHILMDKVLFLRFLRHLHGRFWGIVGISAMLIGFGICFIIRPDLLRISTAFSYFGNDVRTAPYFAGSVFFAAYGLWRWQQYLARTWKRAMPIRKYACDCHYGWVVDQDKPTTRYTQLAPCTVYLAGTDTDRRLADTWVRAGPGVVSCVTFR
jgi:hypothetical protein